MKWRDALKYKGKYEGRRVAHVIDVTLGADLNVIFGRISSSGYGQIMSISDFMSWCDKHKAKQVSVCVDI